MPDFWEGFIFKIYIQIHKYKFNLKPEIFSLHFLLACAVASSVFFKL